MEYVKTVIILTVMGTQKTMEGVGLRVPKDTQLQTMVGAWVYMITVPTIRAWRSLDVCND